MRRTIRLLACCSCVALATAAPAWAQTTAPKPPAKPAPQRPLAKPAKQILRAYGLIDWTSMSASQSFEAVLGSSSLLGFGAGVEALDLWERVFARVTFSFRGDSGTRVIVADGQVVDIGVPVEVKLRDVTVGAGWRQHVHRRVTAYGGAAWVHQGYSEESSFSANPDSSVSFSGTSIFGGVEVPLSKWIIVGGEVEWRSVPDALGDAVSASRAFGETNLGGTALRVIVGIRK